MGEGIFELIVILPAGKVGDVVYAHLERAGLYVDQFATKKITVTIGPAEE